MSIRTTHVTGAPVRLYVGRRKIARYAATENLEWGDAGV